jgi:hypothetical protein
MDEAYERGSLITSGQHKKRNKLTRRQWLTVIVFGLANFTSAVCISLQAPFYPQEVSLIPVFIE